MQELQEWQLQEAKNRFSEVVRRAQTAPQFITVHGEPSAVVISFREYQELTRSRESLPNVMKGAPKDFAELFIERTRDAEMPRVVF